jgi:hypothetical protein
LSPSAPASKLSSCEVSTVDTTAIGVFEPSDENVDGALVDECA